VCVSESRTWMSPALTGGSTVATEHRPDSFYDRIKENRDMGLHTLCLLDIRVKEPDMEAMCRCVYNRPYPLCV